MGYFDNKESMSMKAAKHTQEMEDKYFNEINSAVNFSTIYYPEFNKNNIAECGNPHLIEVLDADTVSAAYQQFKTNPSITPCILNFASYKNAGGKFIEGSSAQEESLCHVSFLYNVLKRFDRLYYSPHRAKGASNKALYDNEAIYTPNVTFFYNGEEFKCDVLTCAAPNNAAARRYYDVDPKDNAVALYDRIYFIRKIMQTNNVKTAILGAYGCGVFGQDPNMVAQYMNGIFTNSTIDTIIYAIPRGLNERNYTTFKNRIAETEV